MRDRCTINNTAVRTSKIVYPQLIDIGCFPIRYLVNISLHQIYLSLLACNWISLFLIALRQKWFRKNRLTDQWLDTVLHLVEQVGSDGTITCLIWRYREILQKWNLRSPHIWSKLWAIFTDTHKRAFVEIELAAIVDWGKPFITATYSLESDGPLIVSGYDIVETINSAICVFDTSKLMCMV